MKETMSETYYDDLRQCVPLTPDRERELATELAVLRAERDRLAASVPSGNGPRARAHRRRLAHAERTCERKRNAFVCANLRLVVRIASQYGDGRLPLSDLIQEGNIGLMIAVDKYDVTRGVRFCTYGTWWIRHRITRAIVNHGRAVRVPNHVAQTSSKVLKAMRKLEALHGKTPALEDVAALTDIKVDKARLALRTTGHALSIDATIGEDARPLHETLHDDSISTVDDLIETRRDNDVNDALDSLAPLEAEILRKRFGDDEMTLREIGDLHSLSRERIRQIQNGALSKMRRRLMHHV
jgi:RNA polymerase primary sigma factor